MPAASGARSEDTLVIEKGKRGTGSGWSHVGFQDSAEGAILEVL